MKASEELQAMMDDLDNLEAATGYDNTSLVFGSVCDSSQRANERMNWVRLALRDNEIKLLVLKKARILCSDELIKEMEKVLTLASPFSKGGIITNPPERILVSEPTEEPKKPKHAGGLPRKVAKVELDSQPKKKRGRPRKIRPTDEEILNSVNAKEPLPTPKEPSDKKIEHEKPVKEEKGLIYHEPCRTCRKSHRDSNGNYPPCDLVAFKTGPSGIETCELWWERGV